MIKTELEASSSGGTERIENEPLVSHFKAPVTNLKPDREVTIWEVYEMITLNMDVLKATHELWEIDPNDKKARRDVKSRKFDYVTFSGTFTNRRSDELKKHSGLLCIDLDHVEKEPRDGEKRRTVWEVKQLLAADPEFETALCFRSPSADGVKWVVVIDLDRGTHLEWFYAICNYLKNEPKYRLEVDTSGKDVTRSCYLPYDPHAIIGEQFRKKIRIISKKGVTYEEIPF